MNDGHSDNRVGERKLIWDEENRLLAVDDNGFVSNYWYDADGERTVKTSGESDQVYVNGVFSGGSTNTAKFSLYVSPYLVANQGGRYTKHIYAGSQRIVSKVGDFASYGSDPRRIEYAGANTDGLSVDYKSKYVAQQQVIKDNYKFFDVPYNGTDNDNYADGEGFCCNDGSMEAAVAEARKAQSRAVSRSFKDPDNYENLQFFYHPDHLGSSSFITDLDGEVVQHIEYVPFGEVFIEERNNVWNTPYLFNAKEFDEETGMYYYGARYYDPRLSLWMSTDPMQEKYPESCTYSYSFNNPIKYIELWGLEPTDVEALEMADDCYNPGKKELSGNWKLLKAICNNEEFKMENSETGFMSALYGRWDEESQSYSEYVYATAGTDFTSGVDWENNFQQLLSGNSEQYRQSVANATIFAGSHLARRGKDITLTFVGHSLGGGLASANALATGLPAITFNAAALSDETRTNLNLNRQANITAYIVRGEIVDYLQSKINMHAEGKRIYLPSVYSPKLPGNSIARTAERVLYHTCGATKCSLTINNLFK